MAKIVVIDDSQDILVQMKAFLENAGHAVYPLMRSEKAVEQVAKYRPDLVITDIIMPGISGGALYHALRAEFGNRLPIIICSGSGMKVKRAKDPLAYQIAKPVDYDFLIKKISEMLKEAGELKSQAEVDMDAH